MTDLNPYAASVLITTDSRRTARTIRRYQCHGQERSTAVDVETDVALTKVDAITALTGQAMGAVVRVAQAQRQLEQLAPEASGRLALLADSHALGLVDVAAELRRAILRR